MTKNCSSGRFTGMLTASDPLQTLFQLLSGRIPAAAMVTHPEHKLLTHPIHHRFICCFIRRPVCILLANKSFDSVVLCPVLWKRKMGRLEAPSGCYALQWDRRSRRPTEGHRHHGGHTRYGRTDWLTGCSCTDIRADCFVSLFPPPVQPLKASYTPPMCATWQPAFPLGCSHRRQTDWCF